MIATGKKAETLDLTANIEINSQNIDLLNRVARLLDNGVHIGCFRNSSLPETRPVLKFVRLVVSVLCRNYCLQLTNTK